MISRRQRIDSINILADIFEKSKIPNQLKFGILYLFHYLTSLYFLIYPLVQKTQQSVIIGMIYMSFVYFLNIIYKGCPLIYLEREIMRRENVINYKNYFGGWDVLKQIGLDVNKEKINILFNIISGIILFYLIILFNLFQ